MDTKTRNNKGKKSSLLMCFKPVVAKDKSFKSKIRKDQSTNQVATYVKVDDERGGDVSLEFSSGFEAADNGGGSRRRENSKDIWQTLRAALNQTSLVSLFFVFKMRFLSSFNKINNKRKASKDNSVRSNRSLENGTEKTNQKHYDVEGKISKSQSNSTHRTNSNISSSYGASSAFTSSPSLTSSSSSRSDQTSGSLDSSNENGTKVTNQKQNGVQDKRWKSCYGSYISMCMFFISLLVLIMWGKIFATLYTIIWFYVMPPGPTRPCNERDLSEDQRFGPVRFSIRRKKGSFK
ncbi:PREDICTED: uncharacterized protein LOC109347091 [Lupinus angustifolius]|uniref:uncharacterized protein LOC109347091 n=1 Tax=Lupinus angustifolius TaxID=3871 RepID=UPI00092F958A|nr:PREDICTED: uncharacterized protein LOC109347091 [Lupinus angustifolius]